MNQGQAIDWLGRFHPQLSLVARTDDTGNRAMRVFDLRAGETLLLRAFGDYDYLYVLTGQVIARIDNAEQRRLHPGSIPDQRLEIPSTAGQVGIEAVESALIYQVHGDELDFLAAAEEVLHLLDPEDDEAARRVRLVRNSKAFHRLPVEAMAEAVTCLRRIEVKTGDEIVRQGEPGDAFYIIEDGDADVWEIGIYDDEPQLVNQLTVGDAFGEDALVMEGSRTATVRMTRGGSLLTLGKTEFDRLIKKEMVNWVDAGTAKSLLDGGYALLDVRYEEEFDESAIPGATLIPLPELRRRYEELDSEKRYVTYCKGGKRSAVACLLLKQRHIEAVSLTGGIMDWPYGVVREAP